MTLIYTVKFTEGSADVQDSDIVAIVAAHTEAQKVGPGQIALLGSACDAPIINEVTKEKFGTNLNLSAARTNNVIKKLLAAGFPEEKIKHGQFFGAVKSVTKAERYKNRIVQVWFSV